MSAFSLTRALPFIVTGFGGLLVFGLGFHIRGELDRGQIEAVRAACAETRNADLMTCNEVVGARQNALTQCEGQVDSFNRAVAQNNERILELRTAQEERDRAARAEARQRQQLSAERAARVETALLNLVGQIENADFGECAGTDTPDDYIRVLNDALDALAGGGGDTDGDSPVPPTGTDN